MLDGKFMLIAIGVNGRAVDQLHYEKGQAVHGDAPIEDLRTQFGDVSLLKAGLDLVGLAGGPARPPRVNVPENARQALSKELTGLGVELTET